MGLKGLPILTGKSVAKAVGSGKRALGKAGAAGKRAIKKKLF